MFSRFTRWNECFICITLLSKKIKRIAAVAWSSTLVVPLLFLLGLKLCMGCPVDKDLVKLINMEVTNLDKEVENIKQSNTDEAKKISDSLQTIRDEIDEYDKRTTDIENRLEAERKERLEKQEALSDAIGDIASNLSNLEKRQIVDEENISLLEKRQSDLEATVSCVKDEQASLF